MKFNLNDFLQLDTKALLAVNGGTHCGGGSGSRGYSSSSGNNSYGSHGGGGSHGGSYSGGGGSCSGSSGGGIGGGGSCSGSSYGGISSGGGSCSGISGSGYTYSPYSFETGENSGHTEGISIPDKIDLGHGVDITGGENGIKINVPVKDGTTVTGTVGLGTFGIEVKIEK